MSKRYRISRIFLIFWAFFIGIGALFGSLCMFCDPLGTITGMSGLLPAMQVLPFSDVLFSDLIFSGIALLIINGIPNIIGAILLILYRKSGIIMGEIAGIVLMLWIIIQFVIYPFNLMSTSYFILGFLQFVTGYVCWVGYKQSKFAFDLQNYQKIGKNGTKLVVFYSRTGYTRLLAHQIADQDGADILEIKTTEKTDGDLGFWWCGRFAMHKWGMPIEVSEVDFSKYSTVTICSPVWDFGISAPIRQFCQQNKGKINNVNYVITHFMSAKFEFIAKEMDDLLGTRHKNFYSFSSRFGNLKDVKNGKKYA